MNEIREKVIDAIIDGARENLNIHMPTILDVYEREGEVSVSMKAKMKPGKNGNMQILSGIKFVESEVKDENLRVVELKQLELGIDSMTFTGAGKRVTLKRDGIKKLDEATKE